MSLSKIKAELKKYSSKEKAKILQGFFKTGIGQYGEGDIFIGIKVPEIRNVAKNYSDLPINICQTLLSSKIHEERLCALVILVNQFNKSDETKRKQIYNLYLSNTRYINNWDLVDLTAPNIIGQYLYDKNRSKLITLAKSKDLWKKRISIVSTHYFIRNNQFKDTIKISKILLNDDHDLIHKAVGWMLREVGKRNQRVEEAFLKKHYKKMPRTMLRYAIERFNQPLRKKYLLGKI